MARRGRGMREDDGAMALFAGMIAFRVVFSAESLGDDESF